MKTPLLLIAVALGLAFPLLARAAAGDLDLSFGSGGSVLTDFGKASGDGGRAVAIESDGKIVAAGFSQVGANGDPDFALARYNRHGSLDSSFGSGGKVLTDFGVASSEQAQALAIDTKGKIVAAGWSLASGRFDFALARYNRDGSLDSSFGSGGKVLTDLGAFGSNLHAIAIESDGKIVAAGDDFSGFALVRYNRDGSLDSTFGSGGKVLTDFGFGSSAWSVAIQPDGKIVAAGEGITAGCFPYDACHDFGLVRYNRDGSLDSSFGSGGKVLTDFGTTGFDQALDMAIEPNGKILAAGESAAAGSDDFALARYNRDGTLDSSFGSGGKVLTDFRAGSNDEAWAVGIEPDRKIVLAGIGGYPFETGDFDFALARYNRDGSLDSSFGSEGKVLTDVGFGADYLFDAAIQPNGKIVAAGDAAGTGGIHHFALVRYLAPCNRRAASPPCARPVTRLSSSRAGSPLRLGAASRPAGTKSKRPRASAVSPQ
jgi:uncharacterized delta-60 repeat protein